jgi:hypothetical protein
MVACDAVSFHRSVQPKTAQETYLGPVFLLTSNGNRLASYYLKLYQISGNLSTKKQKLVLDEIVHGYPFGPGLP